MRVCACLLQMIADRFWTGIHCRNILFTFRAIPSKGVTAILCKARLYVARSASLALNSAAMRSWMITITREVHDYMYIPYHVYPVSQRIRSGPDPFVEYLPPTPVRLRVRVWYVFYWLYFASDLEGTTWKGFKGDRKLWWPWYNVGLLHNPPF